MNNKIYWWRKGKLVEEDDNFKMDPYLKVVKVKHIDEYSYMGYRFWVKNNDNLLIFKLNPIEFKYNSGGETNLNENEIKLVKENKIYLTNSQTVASGDFHHYYYSDLIKEVGENAIYF